MSKYTVEKIAEFVDGCATARSNPMFGISSHAIFLDSIRCAIGAMGAKVTQDVEGVVDVFGGKQVCSPQTRRSSR
jgi:hypothetical protein